MWPTGKSVICLWWLSRWLTYKLTETLIYPINIWYIKRRCGHQSFKRIGLLPLSTVGKKFTNFRHVSGAFWAIRRTFWGTFEALYWLQSRKEGGLLAPWAGFAPLPSEFHFQNSVTWCVIFSPFLPTLLSCFPPTVKRGPSILGSVYFKLQS